MNASNNFPNNLLTGKLYQSTGTDGEFRQHIPRTVINFKKKLWFAHAMCSELVPGARGEGSAVGRQWGAGDCATGCPWASLPEGTQTGCGCGQIYVQLLAGSCGKLSSIFSSNSCLDGEWRDGFFSSTQHLYYLCFDAERCSHWLCF